MAKSIRLKEATQERVTREVRRYAVDHLIVVSDAQVVDALVNEALDARETVKKAKVLR